MKLVNHWAFHFDSCFGVCRPPLNLHFSPMKNEIRPGFIVFLHFQEMKSLKVSNVFSIWNKTQCMTAVGYAHTAGFFF